MSRYHADQAELPLPAVPRPEPNFPALAREDLAVALARVRTAQDRPPWRYRDQRMWRVVGPQMSGWLPAHEQAAFLAEFVPELDRVEQLFTEDEKGKGNG